MINIIETRENFSLRAMGWIQDASDFINLKRLVSAFDRNSMYFTEIVEKINRLVLETDGKSVFLEKLYCNEIVLKYRDIVGTSFTPRSESRCNGIGQAALMGQKREFQGDWPTDNFLRWAVSLQFINHDFFNDTYQITEQGKTFARSIDSVQDKRILKEQFKFYPPVKRVLELIEGESKSKFSIGQELGFIGEKGFTSIPEDLFIQRYNYADNATRKSLKSDYEGSADKYARQIASWLEKLGLVNIERRAIFNDNSKLNFYSITNEGIEFLSQIRLQNTFFVPIGMLSMDSRNSDLHKKRRALLIKFAKENRFTLNQILNKLTEHDISSNSSELIDDIKSIDSCGIDIYIDEDFYVVLSSSILGLEIPSRIIIQAYDEVEEIKNSLRTTLNHVDHRLLSIIDFSYNLTRGDDKKLEDYTAQVYRLISEQTQLLAGPSRPDVVSVINNLGIIIDAKAYRNGFNIPQSEEDKMVRYLTEADKRDETINPTRWWLNLEGASEIVYQFVSSGFTTNAVSKANTISRRSRKDGSLLSAKNLLLLAENYLATNTIDYELLRSNNIINM